MLRFTGWPKYSVIRGRNAPEQPAGIVWNKRPESTGQVADFSGMRTSSDVKKGKRGDYRFIYFWKAGEIKVYLLVAYFKGEKEDITKKRI